MPKRRLSAEWWLGEGLINLGIICTDGRDTVKEKAKINILHMTEHN